MRVITVFAKLLLAAVIAGIAVPGTAADLKEIKARGEIPHLGIKYANFGIHRYFPSFFARNG